MAGHNYYSRITKNLPRRIAQLDKERIAAVIEGLRKKLGEEWPKNPFLIFFDLERGEPLTEKTIRYFVRTAGKDQKKDILPPRKRITIHTASGNDAQKEPIQAIEQISPRQRTLILTRGKVTKEPIPDEEWDREVEYHDPGGYWDSDDDLETIYYFCRALKSVVEKYPAQRAIAEKIIDNGLRYVKYRTRTISDITASVPCDMAECLLIAAMFPSRFADHTDKLTAAMSFLKEEAISSGILWIAAECLLALESCSYPSDQLGHITNFLLTNLTENGHLKSIQTEDDPRMVALPWVLLGFSGLEDKEQRVKRVLDEGVDALVSYIEQTRQISMPLHHPRDAHEWGEMWVRSIWHGVCIWALYSYLGDIKPVQTEVEFFQGGRKIATLLSSLLAKVDKNQDAIMTSLRRNQEQTQQIVSQLETILDRLGPTRGSSRARAIVRKIRDHVATGTDIVVLSQFLSDHAVASLGQSIIQLLKLLLTIKP